MTSIKLTDSSNQRAVYVNPQWIVSMRSATYLDGRNSTQIRTTEGYIFTVAETPEEVNEIIRQSQVPQVQDPQQEEPTTRRSRRERTEEQENTEQDQ